MSIPSRRRPTTIKQFFNPNQEDNLRIETGIERLRREQMRREQERERLTEEINRSKYAQLSTPKGH